VRRAAAAATGPGRADGQSGTGVAGGRAARNPRVGTGRRRSRGHVGSRRGWRNAGSRCGQIHRYDSQREVFGRQPSASRRATDTHRGGDCSGRGRLPVCFRARARRGRLNPTSGGRSYRISRLTREQPFVLAAVRQGKRCSRIRSDMDRGSCRSRPRRQPRLRLRAFRRRPRAARLPRPHRRPSTAHSNGSGGDGRLPRYSTGSGAGVGLQPIPGATSRAIVSSIAAL
jgi:hypothetical protein